MLVGCTEAQGKVCFIDGWLHVGASVHEGIREVVGGQCGIAPCPGVLVLHVRCDETRTGRVVVQDALETLVKLGFVGFGLIGSEERTGRDCARATLELAQGADAVVEELKDLNELVCCYLGEPVIVNKEVVLCMTERVSEQVARQVKHLDGPEDQGLVGPVALLEVRPHGH